MNVDSCIVMDQQITLRPIKPDDVSFLCYVYASTREDELAELPWSDSEKATFLKMQFEAQHTHYQEHFKQANFDLILLDGEPIGRLYLGRRKDEFRVIEHIAGERLPAGPGEGPERGRQTHLAQFLLGLAPEGQCFMGELEVDLRHQRHGHRPAIVPVQTLPPL